MGTGERQLTFSSVLKIFGDSNRNLFQSCQITVAK